MPLFSFGLVPPNGTPVQTFGETFTARHVDRAAAVEDDAAPAHPRSSTSAGSSLVKRIGWLAVPCMSKRESRRKTSADTGSVVGDALPFTVTPGSIFRRMPPFTKIVPSRVTVQPAGPQCALCVMAELTVAGQRDGQRARARRRRGGDHVLDAE